MSKSIEYTLYGDLEGMSVAELRAILARYPDDHRVDVNSRYDIATGREEDYFVIKAAN